MLRKTEMMCHRAMSPTASVEAPAPLQYRMPIGCSLSAEGCANHDVIDAVDCATERTTLGQSKDVDPIVAGAGTGVDLQSWRQQSNQFFIPVPHLAAGMPRRPHDGLEATP